MNEEINDDINDDINDFEDVVAKEKISIPQTMPKKRGRKPKSATMTEEEKLALANTPPPEPKKRGRKPTCQVINNADLIKIKKEPIDECLFIHLPLNKTDIDKVIKKNDNIDINKLFNKSSKENKENKYQSFDKENDIKQNIDKKTLNLNFDDKLHCLQKNDNNNYQTVCKCINCDKLQEMINNIEAKYKINKLNNIDKTIYNITVKLEDMYKNVDLWNKEEKENGERGEEKENEENNICCWWCSHTFDTLPIGLPEKFYNNIFYVTGHFCSFNCAMAYNSSLNDYKMLDRISLLYHMRNMIYLSIYPNRDIKILDDLIVAPPRYMLKMYGGKLNIQEFRDRSIVLKKQYRHIIPPVISLSQPIEESTYNQEQNQIIKQPKVRSLTNLTSGLVLKRNTPTTNNGKYSLYNLMKIQHMT